jgi:hypothetical protein
MTTLQHSLAAYEAEQLAQDVAQRQRIQIRRAYMAGALDALISRQPRETLLAECVQFGRAIGTAAEGAPNTIDQTTPRSHTCHSNF